MNNPLAITMGDPAGIGIEIILKSLNSTPSSLLAQRMIIGSRYLIEKTHHDLLKTNPNLTLIHPDRLTIIDINYPSDKEKKVLWGKGDQWTGEMSFLALKKAIELTLKGNCKAIVTAPIAKTLWKNAGYDYPGQTEVLAQACNISNYGMLFVAKSPHTGWRLNTLLATTHIPLKEVSNALTPALMSRKLELLINYLQKNCQIKNPKIVIAGLNPHSGENGQLGSEEKDWMNNWLQQEKNRYPEIQIEGLIPPDTMWVKPAQAWYQQITPNNVADGYLALYHDQGLIPVKLMAFEQAINTTLGLPFIRTSPDHGTAFDIAGKGIAKADSFLCSIDLADQLSS